MGARFGIEIMHWIQNAENNHREYVIKEPNWWHW